MRWAFQPTIRAAARKSIDRLIIEHENEAYCQPCVSPVWDTALSAHALLEVGDQQSTSAANKALQWLSTRQILDVKGDWAQSKPDVRPGGWAFQYANPCYPDLDDTAVIVMAMNRADPAHYAPQICLAREWLQGLQSANGGWGAFDVDNDKDYLNHIPFADHGALLDPPTADLTARCLSMMTQLGEKPETNIAMQKAVTYLLSNQETDGSWFGRWGMNYIYGTWSALCALNALGADRERDAMTRATAWLKSIQNPDGAGANLPRVTSWIIPATRQPPAQHRKPLGPCWVSWRQESRTVRRSPRGFPGFNPIGTSMEAGTSPFTPPRVSRASSICVITAMPAISRSGRWRGIAT